jgi:hypothetical protein
MTLPQPTGDQKPPTPPKPPTRQQIQQTSASEVKFDDLLELTGQTQDLAATATEGRLILQFANELVIIASQADRVKDYWRQHGDMNQAEGFAKLAKNIREHAEALREKSRRLTPPPTITPVIPPTPPQTKPIIEIKTLTFPSQEELTRYRNDGWQIIHMHTIPSANVDGIQLWGLHAVLELTRQEEVIPAPIPATAVVDQPTRPAIIPEAAQPDDTQPLKPVAPIVPAVAAELPAHIAALAETNLPAAILAGRAANIPAPLMLELYNRQTLSVGRATYQRLQDERDARPPRPLGFIAPHMLTQITITDEVA